MNSNTLSSSRSLGGISTLTPRDPHTTCSPARTSLTGTVRTDIEPVPSVDTTSPQSISGLSTVTQRPSMRTWVSRLVVE